MGNLLLVVVLFALTASLSSAWSTSACKRSFGAVLIATQLLEGSALAKGGPDGSKTNKKFEACVSTCVFDLTKPAPIGSGVERLEAMDQKTAISTCRKKCAKSKAQLMTGEPKSRESLTEEAKKSAD